MKKFVAMALLATLFCINAIAEDLKLHLSCKILTTNEQKVTDSKVVDSVVVLGADKLSITNGPLETIYDFDKEQIIVIDNKNKTYQKTSLYAPLAFVLSETRSREGLFAMMKGAGLKKSSTFSAFNIESNLGIKSRLPLDEKIKFKTENNIYIATYKNKEVARFELSRHKLSNNQADTLNKYLAYEWQLQPDIRKELVGYNKLFKNLSFTKQQIEKMDATCDLIKVDKRGGIDTTLPANYKLIFSENERLNSLIAKGQNKSRMLSIKQYNEKIDSLLEAKRLLGAFLTMNEFVLQYWEFPEQRKDPRLKELAGTSDMEGVLNLSSVQAKTASDVEQLVKPVQPFIDKKIAGYPVLYAFIANQYSYIGDTTRTYQYMYKALDANPFMTQALLDLGGYYLQQYDTTAAFVCFEQAESIVSTHKGVVQRKKVKDFIKSQLPDHFKYSFFKKWHF